MTRCAKWTVCFAVARNNADPMDAQHYGVNASNISLIKTGKTWKHLGENE
jgi:hypothetical protein